MDKEQEFRMMFDRYIRTLFSQIQAESAASYDHNWVAGRLPYDTGNLANNAFKLERTPTGYVIYLDPGLAPYIDDLDKSSYYTHGYWNALCRNMIERISVDWGGSLEMM